MFKLLSLGALLQAAASVRVVRTRNEGSVQLGAGVPAVDDCIVCLQSKNGTDCDYMCIGKSIGCQSCVHWEEESDCGDSCVDGGAEEGEESGSMSKDDTHKPKESDIEVVSQDVTASDACITCLQSGGGRGCASRCSGKSQDCQNCVSYGGGAGCVSRCGGGSGGGPINWSDWNAKVSTYFTVGEVCNYDRRRIPNSTTIQNDILRLAVELDKVRVAWGSGILVNSWYRPPAINSEVGGAPNSQHIYGRAVDIRPSNGNLNGLQSWLDNGIWSNRALGYGAACCGFVHIDLRQGRIRWNYR